MVYASLSQNSLCFMFGEVPYYSAEASVLKHCAFMWSVDVSLCVVNAEWQENRIQSCRVLQSPLLFTSVNACVAYLFFPVYKAAILLTDVCHATTSQLSKVLFSTEHNIYHFGGDVFSQSVGYL